MNVTILLEYLWGKSYGCEGYFNIPLEQLEGQNLQTLIPRELCKIESEHGHESGIKVNREADSVILCYPSEKWTHHVPDGLLSHHFIRGLIEDYCFFLSDGSLEIVVKGEKIKLLKNWLQQTQTNYRCFYEGHVEMSRWNAADFLSQLYDPSTSWSRNGQQYQNYLHHVMKTSFIPTINIRLIDPRAVMPTKIRSTDEGFDLTLISKIKDLGKNTFMFDTGVSVQPPAGYYLQVYPRSSFGKSGYMFNNCVGIIDQGYTGSIKIIMSRVDDSIEDLSLPFKGFQMIICKHHHALLAPINESQMIASSRGVGGHGSTNN